MDDCNEAGCCTQCGLAFNSQSKCSCSVSPAMAKREAPPPSNEIERSTLEETPTVLEFKGIPRYDNPISGCTGTSVAGRGRSLSALERLDRIRTQRQLLRGETTSSSKNTVKRDRPMHEDTHQVKPRQGGLRAEYRPHEGGLRAEYKPAPQDIPPHGGGLKGEYTPASQNVPGIQIGSEPLFTPYLPCETAPTVKNEGRSGPDSFASGGMTIEGEGSSEAKLLQSCSVSHEGEEKKILPRLEMRVEELESSEKASQEQIMPLKSKLPDSEKGPRTGPES